MRLRWCVPATALVVLVAACGGGSSGKGGSAGGGLGGTTTTSVASPGKCDTTLTSADVGVTPKTITVTVLADVNNPIRPGVFKGSWDGVKAWGDYMNSVGGLACRKVVVKEADSKLSPTDAGNAVSAACSTSLGLVGTTALFLQDVSSMESCKDKTGAATGIPDIAVTQTEVAQQCSKVSFAALPTGSACPYRGTGLRLFRVGHTTDDYYFKQFGATSLHGVFVVPKDLPSTITASMPLFRASNRMGIKSDAEFGESGTAIQTDYTQVVQAIKAHKSTYARNGLDYKGTVLERKEAQVQGVDTVKVWDCSTQCYDKRLIQEGGSAVEGQYVWINFLPFEDKGANATLDGFLKYDKAPDGFGAPAFIAGMIFTQAVNDTIKAHDGDPNSITRANILAAIRNIHDFDANGMAAPGIDVGGKVLSTCLVGMQVQHGKFVRVDPVEPGTFDCDAHKPPLLFSIDAAKEYHG